MYDALVAATAMNAKATLFTRDHRAVRTYEAVGVRYRLIGKPSQPGARQRPLSHLVQPDVLDVQRVAPDARSDAT